MSKNIQMSNVQNVKGSATSRSLILPLGDQERDTAILWRTLMTANFECRSSNGLLEVVNHIVLGVCIYSSAIAL